MKTLILQVVFLFTTYHVFTQSKDWKQINTPHKTAVELLYQASDGTLFGLISITEEMVISIDNGITWTIDKSFPSFVYHNSDEKNFEEDKNGRIFCFFDRNIFYFDVVKSEFVKFVTIEKDDNVQDIAFLYNGDLLIGTYRNIFLYSDLGILKKTQEWWTYAPVLLPNQEKNGLNYVIQFVPNKQDAA